MTDVVMMYLQLQQAIEASLLDFCCTGGDMPAELQDQQIKEYQYYQHRQMQLQQASHPSMQLAPKLEAQPQPSSQPHARYNQNESADLAQKLQMSQAAAHLGKGESSDASTTSAEPSLSSQEPSGIFHARSRRVLSQCRGSCAWQ